MPGHPRQPLQQHAVRRAPVERVRVVPALDERAQQVADHRTAQLEGRRRATAGAGRTGGSISGACGSPACVASSRRPWHRSMPPTNATSRPGAPRCWTTNSFWWCEPNRRTRWSSSTSAAGLVELAAEPLVLLRVEAQPVGVRAPQQAAHLDPGPGQVAEHLADLVALCSSRSSASPRQSVKKTRSPARSGAQLLVEPRGSTPRRGRAGRTWLPARPRPGGVLGQRSIGWPGCRAPRRVRNQRVTAGSSVARSSARTGAAVGRAAGAGDRRAVGTTVRSSRRCPPRAQGRAAPAGVSGAGRQVADAQVARRSGGWPLTWSSIGCPASSPEPRRDTRPDAGHGPTRGRRCRGAARRPSGRTSGCAATCRGPRRIRLEDRETPRCGGDLLGSRRPEVDGHVVLRDGDHAAEAAVVMGHPVADVEVSRRRGAVTSLRWNGLVGSGRRWRGGLCVTPLVCALRADSPNTSS